MSAEEALRERLGDEAQSASVILDVDAIVELGRRSRRRRRASTVGGVAVAAALVAFSVWQAPLVSGPTIPAGTGATTSASGEAPSREQPTTDPSPGDPGFVWPTVDEGYNTQMDWWNSPGLERFDEVAAEHPHVLVIDTSIMAVVEDNLLAPTFETRIPTTPVPINPQWPDNSIVVVDALTYEIVGSAPVDAISDPEVYWPLPPNPVAVPDGTIARWADLIPGYELTASSDAPYGQTGTQLLLYQDDTSLAIVVATTVGDDLKLSDLVTRIDQDELVEVRVDPLAQAVWGEDRYGVVFAGVDQTGSCGVRLWHQQTAEPIVTPDFTVDELITDVVPNAAALACS